MMKFYNLMLCGLMLAGVPLTASAQEAQIGTESYATLAEAFEAANENETIKLLGDVTVAEMIPVTKSVTLDLAGHTITNNVEENRLFRLSQVTFTIDGNNGKVITPAENTTSYGFVDFRDANGTAYAGTKLIASDVYFEGTTDDGSCFAIRTNGQDIEFTNVGVTLNNSKTWSIINAYAGNGNFKINGGTYNYTSTVPNTGPFQFTHFGSTAEISNVTVTSNAGPIMEIAKGTATVTNCKMTNTATNAHYVACLAASKGATLTIDGAESEYTSAIPVYVYNSGATINIDGGTYNGTIASIKADNINPDTQNSVVNITSGTFIGAITPDANSLVNVDESSELVETVDEQGNTAYVALPKDSDIAAFVGLTPYATLSEAFEAAKDGDKIVVFKDLDINSMIPVTKSVTLDLAGHTITNNIREQNRLFRLSQVTFTINGNNGKIVTPDDNTITYGFVDFRDTNGTAYAGTKLIASDVYFGGPTGNGSCFAIRADGQDIEFTNVDVTVTKSQTWSIINAYSGHGNFKINGGTYNYSSTVPTTGPFQFTNTGSTVEISNVTVTSDAGPIMEIAGGTATVTNCKMTNTATNAHYVACLAASKGATLTIDGAESEYTSAIPVYVYNSGATINIDGGTYNGTTAAIKIDKVNPDIDAVVNVNDGTFNGPLSVADGAVLSLKGGTYTDSNADSYVAEGYSLYKNSDGTYGVKPKTTSIGDIENNDAIPANSRVYNLQGIPVAESIDALDTLPAGIYIVAGRKILVK